MYRFSLDYLKDWAKNTVHKPIVLRGARQVGKSHLVRMLAEQAFESFLEINFEQSPGGVQALFESKTPQTICRLLEAKFNTNIQPGKTLLFLDEIQSAPEIFATLRYFYEEMPALHVIAAGSLLEFVLEEHTFSMPVGRIQYLHLGPMQFEEFLIALGREKLRDYLCNFSIGEKIPTIIHNDLMNLLKQYLLIGGMPEAVASFVKTGSFREVDEIKQSILSTYRADFNKYGRKVKHSRIEKVFTKIPLQVGNKLKYNQIDREERSRDLQQALHVLSLARVLYPVYHSASNGVPLGAEEDSRNFKVLFLDVGLLCKSCGLSITDFENFEDILLVNAGGVAEQFIGQHLLFLQKFYEEPVLHYWMREKKGSSAEVDYVISIGPSVVPVEVKAGKSGTMKSLHLFLREKKRNFGIRFNSDLPSLLEAQTAIPDEDNIPFRLLSLPLYAVGQTMRLYKLAMEK